jgi:hypothetical protein
MITIPQNEQHKFKNIILGNAKLFGFTPEDYIRKVWYHEEAAKLGEYVALSLMNELLLLVSGEENN